MIAGAMVRRAQLVAALAVAAALGCDPGPESGAAGEEGPAAEIAWSEAIPTVATVSWSGEADGGFVEVGRAGGAWRRIAAERQADGDWRAVVVGLRQGTDYQLRAGTIGEDGSETLGPAVDVTTGGASAKLPDLFLDADAVADDPGLLATTFMGGSSYAVLLDADGLVTWWYANPYEGRVMTRTLPSRSGRSVFIDVARSIDLDSEGNFGLLEVAWDGTLLRWIETSALHHDFLELPSGDLVFLSDEKRVIDGVGYSGDLVVVLGGDGMEHTLWSAWDYYDPTQFAGQHDFAHANALRYDESTDTLWLGVHNANQLLQLDPTTGAVRKRVFGRDTDYPLSDGSGPLSQHNFTLLPSGVLIHDNRDAAGLPARVVEFALTESPAGAAQVWEYEPTDAFTVAAFGDALRLADGDTIAVWGSAGVIDRVDADGALRTRFSGGLGTAFGYAQWLDDLQPVPQAE